MKHIKSQNSTTGNINEVGCVYYIDFSSNASTYHSTNLNDSDLDTWIVDTEATSHMCHNLQPFVNPTTSSQNNFIKFPDGTCMSVTHTGSIHLHLKLLLANVVYIHSFKFNLLSVSKLNQNHKISIKFFHGCYILQDLVTKVLAEGRLQWGLYKLIKHNLVTIIPFAFCT